MKDRDPYTAIATKGGMFYVILYYYKNGKRHTKWRATGISASDNNKRKANQNKRAAEKMARELLAANDIITYFTSFYPVKTDELTTLMIEDYIAWERTRRQSGYDGPHKRRSKSTDGSGIENTVLHRVAVIRMVLQAATRDRLITSNPASKRDSWIELPQPQKAAYTVLNTSEARAFLSALSSEPRWFQLAANLALLFGLRRSEIIGLRISDIDTAQRRITIRNTVTQRKRSTVTVNSDRKIDRNGHSA